MGDNGKVTQEDLGIKIEAKEEPKDKVVLEVIVKANGQPEWRTSLSKPQLNWILDILKLEIMVPQEPKIVKPSIINNIKGAFGGKRF